MDAFSFEAVAGERVRIRMSDPDGNFGMEPRIELFDAQGNRMEIAESSTDAVLQFAMNKSDKSYALLSDCGGVDQGENVQTIARLNVQEGEGALPYGQEVGGSFT